MTWTPFEIFTLFFANLWLALEIKERIKKKMSYAPPDWAYADRLRNKVVLRYRLDNMNQLIHSGKDPARNGRAVYIYCLHKKGWNKTDIHKSLKRGTLQYVYLTIKKVREEIERGDTQLAKVVDELLMVE